jgi:Putative peptidoglycan binding domain
LLGLAACAAAAATDTAAKKSAPASGTSATSSKHHAGGSATTTHSSTRKGKHSRAKTKSSRKRGQQVIDSGRAREIQEALIREHYLEGEPSGNWDSATQAAMQRYQADQGWQSKTTPDSRALIKLGLGPNHDHLLNPESAMTTAPLPVDAKAGTKPRAADPPTAPSASTPAESSGPPQ